eukprot:CAMPEP_0178937188 /NCGR_PEP_ID=MMETSP0786-20121207/25609_1 /TAXON_ID=186022 /ORGANISM="Thalassionema frauenfeldii, Strain CCMP 1798" /LENGTH=382 /DNA_ID=CAMNT_0020615713 /DNA_START=51 /DNA_END=1199 /DNA_ORIENTATION=-
MRLRKQVVLILAALIKFKPATAFQPISPRNYFFSQLKKSCLDSGRMYASKKEESSSSSNGNEKRTIFSFRSKKTSSDVSRNSSKGKTDLKSDRNNVKTFFKKAFGGKKDESPDEVDKEKNSKNPLDSKLEEIRVKINEDRKIREKIEKEQQIQARRVAVEQEKKRHKDQMMKKKEEILNAKQQQERLKRDKNTSQSESKDVLGNEKNRVSRDKNEADSGFNPMMGTQKLISNVWESTIGSRDQWVFALRKRRIDPGEVVPVNVAGLDLLIIASRKGDKIYCVANSCSHLGTPLETGPLQRRKANRPTDSSDGCEDCIVCPLHQTAFSVETGEVNGPWCPYPPVIGNIMGTVKEKSPIVTFDIRTRGKNIEVKLNSRIPLSDS